MKLKCTTFENGFTIGAFYRCIIVAGALFTTNDEGILVLMSDLNIKRKV